MLIRQEKQKSAIFFTIRFFKQRVSTKCLQCMPQFINDVYES